MAIYRTDWLSIEQKGYQHLMTFTVMTYHGFFVIQMKKIHESVQLEHFFLRKRAITAFLSQQRSITAFLMQKI